MITNDLELTKIFLDNAYVIGLPTETVYGLAGNIYSEKAIKSIFELKGRPLYNPLIVHIKNKDALSSVAKNIPDSAHRLAEKFWPGPLTLILPKKSSISDLITAGKSTVAVRVPNHEQALALLNLLEYPLAAPSANPFGSISPTSAGHVYDYFGKSLPAILEGGPCTRGIESTIVGFDGNRPIIYRLGSLSVEEIEDFLGIKVQTTLKNSGAPEAPGMLSKHYAPRTPLIFTNDLHATLENYQNQKVGVLSFRNERLDFPSAVHLILSADENLNEAASRLYHAMHQLDDLKLDVIVAKRFPELGLGKAINDRLQRAAKQCV